METKSSLEKHYISLYDKKVRKIMKHNTYAQLNLRQTRRLVKLMKAEFGNINMMDFHTHLLNILESHDLPF